MIRKIIEIDTNKCNGCGLCVHACHENAIGLIDGKAHLLREDYCDGLGDCLPNCPMNAISFTYREALSYDEEAVMENKKQLEKHTLSMENTSQLKNWPVQIKLAPVNDPVFKNADLLIAADCTAFSYGSFHEDFMKNKVTLIGCPKLDFVNYAKKLSEIIKNNSIASITLVIMEVPCCKGLLNAIETVLEEGKDIPLSICVISCDGKIISKEGAAFE